MTDYMTRKDKEVVCIDSAHLGFGLLIDLLRVINLADLEA